MSVKANEMLERSMFGVEVELGAVTELAKNLDNQARPQLIELAERLQEFADQIMKLVNLNSVQNVSH